MNKYSLLTLIFLFSAECATCFAQKEATNFSLNEAIQYGVKNHSIIKKSKLEQDIYIQNFLELRAAYLPLVKLNSDFYNNLQLPTNFLPGEIFGKQDETIAVKFGTKYTMEGALAVTQKIYDPTRKVAFSATKPNLEIAQINVHKTQQQVIYDIASAYITATLAQIQKKTLANNIQKLDTLMAISKSQIANGFAKKIDLSRLIINQTNFQTELQNLETDYQQQLIFLKYYMAYPLENEIVLTSNMVATEAFIPANGQATVASYDLDLLSIQHKLTDINIKQLKASYLPTLDFGFNYGFQFQSDKANFMKKTAQWFPVSAVGLNMSLPLFDGNYKKAKINQLKIKQLQLDLDKQELEASIDMQRKNTQLRLNSSENSLNNQLKNIKLAEEVLASTLFSYKSGMGNMSDLLNAETALQDAQNNYLRVLAQTKLAELEVLKASGAINSLIN
jgi:outer membrane protein